MVDIGRFHGGFRIFQVCANASYLVPFQGNANVGIFTIIEDQSCLYSGSFVKFYAHFVICIAYGSV